MPPTKEAYTRYRIINSILVHNKGATLRELRRACANSLGKYVSERTIKTDIEDMRYDPVLGFDAPIVYDRGGGRYYYNRKDYAIDQFTLKEEEVQSLI